MNELRERIARLNFLQQPSTSSAVGDDVGWTTTLIPKKSPYNTLTFADLLCDLVNRDSVSLSYVRRMTLIESIKDIVMKEKGTVKRRRGAASNHLDMTKMKRKKK